MDKGKGQISGADDESFIEVKRKKLDSNYGGNKHFKPVSVKQKTQYRPKAKQSTARTCNSFKMALPVGTNKALNVDDPIIEEVAMTSKVTTTVASARALVDESILETDLVATRWNRNIPIKVNIFLWRLNLNKLPTRVNLERKGVVIGSSLCPLRHLDVETANHLFFNCELATSHVVERRYSDLC
nr:RNA-directed DNA polymerase, eukaryota [Tanacetum cinerariifolium]